MRIMQSGLNAGFMALGRLAYQGFGAPVPLFHKPLNDMAVFGLFSYPDKWIPIYIKQVNSATTLVDL